MLVNACRMTSDDKFRVNPQYWHWRFDRRKCKYRQTIWKKKLLTIGWMGDRWFGSTQETKNGTRTIIVTFIINSIPHSIKSSSLSDDGEQSGKNSPIQLKLAAKLIGLKNTDSSLSPFREKPFNRLNLSMNERICLVNPVFESDAYFIPEKKHLAQRFLLHSFVPN